MGPVKRVRDPIYGYIEIDAAWFDLYIDQPGFQRLRRIVQTSYGPLYPSALHNRFVHSLGVYHLGCRAAAALTKEVEARYRKDDEKLAAWSDAVETFKLACLLHDYGHSPFSHSGEIFYEPTCDDEPTCDEGDSTKDQPASLQDELIRLIDDDGAFASDVVPGAAPHEIMSAILAIKEGLVATNKSLFARCIVGYKYTEQSKSGLPDGLENVLIEMLHSDTIDVDRLDYLIRDAYVVGFDSISIDYVRLLDGLRIVRLLGVESGNACYAVAFDKSAMSVLENVVYARDNEKKWIQAHPVVLYDQMLVQHAIRKVRDSLRDPSHPPLFSRLPLTERGAELANGRYVRLLSDDDIVSIMKNELYGSNGDPAHCDPLVVEYFRRCDRRHPVWKSEAEYRSLFCADSRNREIASVRSQMLRGMEKALSDGGLDGILNDDTLKALEAEKESLGEKRNAQTQSRARSLEAETRFLRGLRDFCRRKNDYEGREGESISFDFALVTVKRFKSGFESSDLRELPIVFGSSQEGYRRFGEVTRVLESGGRDDRGADDLNCYYLYHRRASKPDFPKKELVEFLKREGYGKGA